MRIPIAREGYPIIGGAFLLAFLAFLVPVLRPVGWLLAFVGLFSLWFFRDFEREIPQDPGAVLSPADGTVLRVEEVDEQRFLGGRARLVAIFMSPLNCHINRAPVDGTVRYVSYVPGQFAAAYREKESELNEQNWVGIEGPTAKVLVRQIAGFLARRIVCRVRPDDRLQRGQRFGLIQFGSRCDVFVPLDVKVLVKPGEPVYGGITVVGRLEQA